MERWLSVIAMTAVVTFVTLLSTNHYTGGHTFKPYLLWKLLYLHVLAKQDIAVNNLGIQLYQGFLGNI